MGERKSLVRPSSREARLTVSPIAVYSSRCWEPMVPTTASPGLIPTPFRRGTPDGRRFSRCSRMELTARCLRQDGYTKCQDQGRNEKGLSLSTNEKATTAYAT